MNERSVLHPGSTIGLFGGGQLGRMFIMAAVRLGYRVIVFTPSRDDPAAQIASAVVEAPYDDLDAVRRFARQCDVVTLEFENVPDTALAVAGEWTLVRPGVEVLRIAQDRLRERAFLGKHGFPVAPHRTVTSAGELRSAMRWLGAPVMVKSVRCGYDGRGQMRVDGTTDVDAAWRGLGTPVALCESVIEFQGELSVLVARTRKGEVEVFGPIENHHAHGILEMSVAPPLLAPRLGRAAIDMARAIAVAMDLEGLICVEMFLTADGSLLVNELAPRPHNSGHLTIEACAVSQFEQQVRAICNLPLADLTPRSPAVMLNLLGDLWDDGPPEWSRLLAAPSVALHLYGKDEPHARRKMGHLTAIGATVGDARRRALDARQLLADPATVAGDRAYMVAS